MPIVEEYAGQLRHGTADAFYKIKLRLNAAEREHIKLESLMRESVERSNRHFSRMDTSAESVLASIDLASEQARVVLKAEWVRVKNGEPVYQTARRVAFGLAIVFCAGAFVLGYWTFLPAAADATPQAVSPQKPATATRPLALASRP